jgi:hypothetical protein
MSELPPLPRSVEPRPRSNWASIIISGSIAILALVCSVAVLCVTTENQCNDRRDRRILQQPNVWLDRVRDEGAIYLVNSGPGAALIKEYSLLYKKHPAMNEMVGGSYQDLLNSRIFGAEGEWAFGFSSLFLLRDDARRCAGGTDGCLRVGVDFNYLYANYMMSPGQRLPMLRITNIDEIEKRVTADAFRAWQNAFGAGVTPDDVDFRIEYCPLSSEFGPCRAMTHKELSAFPNLPACPSGIAGLLPSWITWWR